MIVYGDAKIRTYLQHAYGLLLSPGPFSLDELRTRLILAGQIEQGLEDARHPQAALVRQITDLCAASFVRRYLKLPAAKADLNHLILQLDALSEFEFKVAEGYQCYRLYPDQYIEAALQVLQAEQFESAAIIGIRTIGTSLSAVVAETLKARGKEIRRLTVRPTGDPYQRELSPLQLDRGDLVLVVDEGPGQSGSSFAAVHRALPKRAKVVFLPGHANPPGPTASEAVREVWKSTSCYVHDPTPALEEQLRQASARYLGIEPAEVELSTTDAWPTGSDAPTYAPFEQPKYLATERGSQVRIRGVGTLALGILWVYYGLDSCLAGATRAYSHLEVLHHLGHGIEPLGLPVLGFLPLKLVEWAPAANVTLDEILDYLRCRPQTEDIDFHTEESCARLAHMAYWNAHKALGPEAAEQMHGITPEAPPTDIGLFGNAGNSSYYDGRLHLSNWVRNEQGKLVKLDGVGHAKDNTVIGTQHILWDIAGAIIELGIDEKQLLARTQLTMATSHVPFYKAAYLTFWLGMARMSADILGPEDHRTSKLEQEFTRYKNALTSMLQ